MTKVIIGCRGLALERLDSDKHRFKHKKYHGKVILKDRVSIGANSVIQKGVFRNTVLNEGVKIGPMCNIGHDVIIGENARITGSCCLCGYVEIGKNVYIGPHSTIKNRVKIGDYAYVGIGSLVLEDVKAHDLVYGHPAKVRGKSPLY